MTVFYLIVKVEGPLGLDVMFFGRLELSKCLKVSFVNNIYFNVWVIFECELLEPHSLHFSNAIIY